MDEAHGPIYQLTVSLQEIEPPVWRRIQVYRHKRFVDLHLTLQAVMGWLNYHLHLFEVGETTIADEKILREWEEEGVDDSRARLMDFVQGVGTTFIYEYDFGDSWRHELTLEAILPVEPKARYPRCLDGARACPPEDVGGVWGYERFLEAMATTDDEEHEEFLEWAGGDFKAEAFSVRDVNRRLQHGYTWHGHWVVPALATGPTFTGPAERLWAAVPTEARARVLKNTWCAHCRRATTMIDYQGRVQKGDLLLEGHCVVCGGRVVRLLEGR